MLFSVKQSCYVVCMTVDFRIRGKECGDFSFSVLAVVLVESRRFTWLLINCYVCHVHHLCAGECLCISHGCDCRTRSIITCGGMLPVESRPYL